MNPKKLGNHDKLLLAETVHSIKWISTDVSKLQFILPYVIHQNFFALLTKDLDMNLKGNFNSNTTIPDKLK